METWMCASEDFRCVGRIRLPWTSIMNWSVSRGSLHWSFASQNIEDLIRREKLHLIKESPRNKLILKSDVLQRLWQ